MRDLAKERQGEVEPVEARSRTDLKDTSSSHELAIPTRRSIRYTLRPNVVRALRPVRLPDAPVWSCLSMHSYLYSNLQRRLEFPCSFLSIVGWRL